MTLSEDAKRRYARQMVLLEIGEVGQEKLLASKVLVIGAGGLGSPALLYLAGAGVGTLGIVDDDRVDLSNLQRQILHETADIGRAKVESASDTISDLNPDSYLNILNQKINCENAQKLVQDYDIVVDGSDNFETRFAVHDACFAARKPLVSAAVLGFEGQLSVFKAYEGEEHPCYRCIYPELPPVDTMPDCSENGTLGAVTGILGAWQAAEVVKELLGIGESLSGSLLIFDILEGAMRKVKVPKDPACKLCVDKERLAA